MAQEERRVIQTYIAVAIVKAMQDDKGWNLLDQYEKDCLYRFEEQHNVRRVEIIDEAQTFKKCAVSNETTTCLLVNLYF